MAITSAGIGSGLDLESIISTFVNAERMPRENAINKRELRLESEISGVGTLKSAVSKFNDVLKKLADPQQLMQNKTTISYQGSQKDNLPFSVVTSDLVARGKFEVTVDALAQGSQLRSAALALDPAVDAVGSGNLTFSAGGSSFVVAVDPADTLEKLRDKINSAGDNFGVQANIINTDAGPKLVYNSEVTGTGNDLSVTNDNASLDQISTAMASTKTAQNASITLDGETLTSSTNKFADAISGLNIEVTAETALGEVATLEIANDTEGAGKLIQEFVDGYNELRDQLSSLGNPKSGLLAFDPAVRQLQSQLSQLVPNQNLEAPVGLQSLYELGITVDNTGRMSISSAAIGSSSGKERLDAALNNNIRGIGTLFAGTDGIAKKMSELTENYVGTDGFLNERSQTLEAERTTLSLKREELETYLADYESTLRKRYTALDTVMAKYTATSSYLTGIFENLNANNKK